MSSAPREPCTLVQRYLTDREQLERWIVELIMSRVDLSLPARASWRKRVRLLLERVREVAGAHPAVVPLVLQHRQSSPSLYRWAEALLGALADAGLRGQRRTLAFRALVSYLVGALQTEHLAPLSGAGTAMLAQLPRGEFPLLATTAREALRIGPEVEFRQGVTLLIRGLARTAAGSGDDGGS